MNPEKYKNLVLSVTESNEDAKTLLGLVYVLKEYASEEALMKNFVALKGKEEDGKNLLKSLRRKRVLGRGPYDEYICPAGHEDVFNDFASGCLQEPPKLSKVLKEEVEAGNNAAIKMIELLLKIHIHGITGFTQYELVKADISDMFSPAVFQSLESKFIAENVCVYGQRRPGHEFLWIYHQSDDEIMNATDMLKEFREKELYKMPLTRMVEGKIGDFIQEAKREQKGQKEEFAEWTQFSEAEIDTLSGYFTGFTINDDFLSLYGNMYVKRDTLHLVVTDKLSRYDIREWREQPVVFITEEMPRWVERIRRVFEGAYPNFSDRKLAIAVPNKVAYTNFKQELLSTLLRRWGIEEVLEL